MKKKNWIHHQDDDDDDDDKKMKMKMKYQKKKEKLKRQTSQAVFAKKKITISSFLIETHTHNPTVSKYNRFLYVCVCT